MSEQCQKRIIIPKMNGRTRCCKNSAKLDSAFCHLHTDGVTLKKVRDEAKERLKTNIYAVGLFMKNKRSKKQ